MKLTHSVKFQLNKQYEMHELTMEVTEDDYPETAAMSPANKMRFLQGTLIMQGLVFQVASGYLNPKSEEFRQAKALAMELKDVDKKKE